MIDLGKEFFRMAQEFGIDDKEVLKSVRTMLREAWGSSIFKQEFLKRNSQLVVNDNPRSKKKYPKVRKYKCAICGELFGSSEIELDHVSGENKLTSYDHINDFILSIVLVSPDGLQVLCKDKWKYKTKIVNGKKKKVRDELLHMGCHGKKGYSERYDVTFEQAELKKEYIHICKDKKLLIDKLKELSVESIPKTLKAQKELLSDLMLNLGEHND